MPTAETVTREVVVTLTDAELRERGSEMALLKLEAENLAQERKQLNASIRGKMDRVSTLAKAIDTRKETREVVCEWRPDYKKKRWVLTRLDTKQALPEEREMTAGDLQTRLASVPAPPDDEVGQARARKKGGARKAAKRLN